MPRRSTPLRPDEFAALVGRRVVRVVELEALGLQRSTIAKRCRPGGPWRSLAPGIVLLTNAPPTRDDRRRGALLYAGQHSVLTGLDALQLHGMRRVRVPSGAVHTLVPADRRRTGHGLALIERTDRLPATQPGRWPLAPISRAVLDFARRSTERDEVRSAIAEVVQRGRCTVADLAAELAAGSGRGRALPRTVLEEVGDGVRSVAEAKARELIRPSGLPQPLWNPWLLTAGGTVVACPDAWFDDVALAWEIDSKEWHLDPADYERTLDRRAAMMAEGIVVVHTQPRKIALEPHVVLDILARNLTHARLRPRPAVFAVPAEATNGTFGR